MKARLLLFFFGLFTAVQGQTESLLPSAALRATFAEIATNRQQQGPIAGGYLARAQKDNLNEAERLALAELYFVALKPDEARAAYQPFLDAGGLRGRLAWQRLMRMTAVAYNDYERVERLIAEYRREFAPDKRDPYHTYAGTQALTVHLAGKGEHAKVAALILDEIASLPADHPCYVASLIAPNFASFKAAGRETEAITALRQKRELMESLAASGYPGWPVDELPRIEEIRAPQSFFERILAGYRRTLPPAPPAKS